MNLENVHKVHMLGIGGIGMSALARFLKLRGIAVGGYDRTETPLTRALVAEGIPVHYTADPAQVAGADLVVYTPAVSRTHPEYLEAQRLGLPILKRAELLGRISRTYKTIAIGGTHGKTSTTGLTSWLLHSCGANITAFIGGICKNFGSNFVAGTGEWVVVEADEFDRSFLQLSPTVAIITSMDPDHLDIYGDADTVTESYREFARRLQPGGQLFGNARLETLLRDAQPALKTYGMNAGECRAENVRAEGLGSRFDYVAGDTVFRDLYLGLPGRYNVENATAAISACLAAGGHEAGIRQGLASFTGIQRRFDIRHDQGDLSYVDDYAHHPEEIFALLRAVKDMAPGRKIIAAFQPHLFTRTRDFYPGFAEALSLADAVLVLDIYPAREEPIAGITSALILDRVTAPEKAACTLATLPQAIQRFQTRPAVVLTIGAGDIDTQVENVRATVAAWT